MSRTQVEAVLTKPLRRFSTGQRRDELQGMIEQRGRSMLLRVIVEAGDVVTVITVIPTSKLEKYGGTP